jgi:hypothetical protein
LFRLTVELLYEFEVDDMSDVDKKLVKEFFGSNEQVSLKIEALILLGKFITGRFKGNVTLKSFAENVLNEIGAATASESPCFDKLSAVFDKEMMSDWLNFAASTSRSTADFYFIVSSIYLYCMHMLNARDWQRGCNPGYPEFSDIDSSIVVEIIDKIQQSKFLDHAAVRDFFNAVIGTTVPAEYNLGKLRAILLRDSTAAGEV